MLLIVVSVACAALAQARALGLVYVVTGLPLDALAGRAASFPAVRDHWRIGFVKGAIYGGVFMSLMLCVQFCACAIPGVVALAARFRMDRRPIGGALAFPFAQT